MVQARQYYRGQVRCEEPARRNSMALFSMDIEIDRSFITRTLVSGHRQKNLHLNNFRRIKRTKAAGPSSTAIPGWESTNGHAEIFCYHTVLNTCIYLFAEASGCQLNYPDLV